MELTLLITLLFCCVLFVGFAEPGLSSSNMKGSTPGEMAVALMRPRTFVTCVVKLEAGFDSALAVL